MGKPGAARAVGQACNANPLPLIVPCHRVTCSTGLGGFAGGDTAKKFLLALEERTLLKGEGAIVVEV
jgi:methylated-DNA-[protein]-cysteine S-methyltransferase